MEKIVFASSLCHERITPQACFVRLEMAREKGWTVVEVPPGATGDIPGGGEYVLVEAESIKALQESIESPQPISDLVANARDEKIGLGSAFLLVIVIVGFILAFRFYSSQTRSDVDEYEPTYYLNPWQLSDTHSSQNGIPNMQQVFPKSSQPKIDRPPGAYPQPGLGDRLNGVRAETQSYQHPLPPPTEATLKSPPTSHYRPSELAPELPNSVLRLLPFDPRGDIELFEYDCFKEVKRLIPDMNQEKTIYLLWAVRKSGTDEKYKAAKGRYDIFLENWKALKTEY